MRQLKVDLTSTISPARKWRSAAIISYRRDYIGAINRFRTVVEQYPAYSQIAEALERLTEAYYALGIYDEAKTAAAVLGANYPGSPWYRIPMICCRATT